MEGPLPVDTLLLPVAIVNRQKCKISQFFGRLGTNSGTIQGIGVAVNVATDESVREAKVSDRPSYRVQIPGQSILSFGWS